jgi:small subunit ribosomal protein S8
LEEPRITLMGKDTIADVLTTIRNTNMNKNGMVQVISTIIENIVKILLPKGFIECV